MAIYKTTDGKIKTIPSGARLIEGTFTDMTGQSAPASVWEKDKDGNLFPNFDQIPSGIEFEANAWTNPKTGKIALYAPKPPKTPNSSFTPKSFAGGASKAPQIAKAMETKAENIEKAQDRTSANVKLASCNRGATEILTSLMAGDKNIDASNWKESWKTIRKDLFQMWDYDDSIPF